MDIKNKLKEIPIMKKSFISKSLLLLVIGIGIWIYWVWGWQETLKLYLAFVIGTIVQRTFEQDMLVFRTLNYDIYIFVSPKEKGNFFKRIQYIKDPKNPPPGSKRVLHKKHLGGRPMKEPMDDEALDLIRNHGYSLYDAFEKLLPEYYPKEMYRLKINKDRIKDNYRKRMKRKLEKRT